MYRTWKFKLIPNKEQCDNLHMTANVVRFVYNLALEQRSNFYRQYKKLHNKNISFNSQSYELTKLREEVDWIRECSRKSQVSALMDLDDAFERYFRGISGYPTPRKKGKNESFRVPFEKCRVYDHSEKFAFIRLPKIGRVRFRKTQEIDTSRIVNATAVFDALGWHVCFTYRFDLPEPKCLTKTIGIDRGITRSLSFSDGTFSDMPTERLAVIERRRRRLQRVVSRRKKGGANRRKAKARVKKLSSKMARIRLYWQHTETRKLADSYGYVAIEELKVKNMSSSAKGTRCVPGRNVRQKSGLNRAILNQAWHQFECILSYKMEETGGKIVKVNPKYTSQTCSSCGSVRKENRKSQAIFSCVDCGSTKNADTNAAMNIERRGNFPLLPVDAVRKISNAADESGSSNEPVKKEEHLDQTVKECS
jgi:putative transposase